MQYFSGFLFENEAKLFSDYIPKGEGVVAGFSYGAIKACEYAYSSGKRVERLILLSPAFFEDKNESYIKKQLKFYDNPSYKESFFANVSYPSRMDLSHYYYPHSKEDLEILLRHQWDRDKLEKLVKLGVNIEVFLGGKDRVINASRAYDFFSTYAIIYLIKESGHSLQLK